ncbi:hypothetical protein S2091_0365 [Solimicrobium silvestre]|uniref:Uncharacterized protein n=1 Tax=Solimicrobium silvestre TaxID=2099400 RepID=A0A2S9H5A6_9BURK|nr:hypothetical protein S2091_0365 [Solimicrobium silvestre]
MQITLLAIAKDANVRGSQILALFYQMRLNQLGD